MPYKDPKDRKYTGASAAYGAQPEQKKNRAARNAARAKMMKAGKVKKGDGMQVDHIKPVSKGGKTVMANLRVLTASANDSFKRNSKRQLVSQTSDKERRGRKK